MLTVLRIAARSLRKAPGYSLAVVASLTAGIAACALTFSAMDAQWADPAIADIDNVLHIAEATDARCAPYCIEGFRPDALAEFNRSRPPSVGPVAGYAQTSLLLSRPEIGEPIDAAIVDGDFFPALRIPVVAGRLIDARDCSAGDRNLAVVSEGMARETFGGPMHALGAVLSAEELSYTVIGVVPRGVSFPAGARVWLGCADWRGVDGGARRTMLGVTRVAMGIDADVAGSAFEFAAQQIRRDGEARAADRSVVAQPLKHVLERSTPVAHRATIVGVWLAFLVACANVANLTLTRTLRREHDIATRRALGATARDIAAPLLAESLILSGVSVLIGLAIASQAVNTVSRMAQASFGFMIDLVLAPGVVAATVALAVVTAVVFGLAPMAQLRDSANAASLLRGGAGTSQRRTHAQIKHALVAVQTALVLILGLSTTVLVRAYVSTTNARSDFDVDEVLIATPRLTGEQIAQAGGLRASSQVLGARLAGTTTNGRPEVMARYWNDPEFEGDSLREPWLTRDGYPPLRARSSVGGRYGATPGLLRTLGVRIIDGRDFSDSDDGPHAQGAIINETAARYYWPGENPVGKRFKFGPAAADQPWRTVIGVARGTTLPEDGGRAIAIPVFYLPLADSGVFRAWLVARRAEVVPGYGDAVKSAVADLWGSAVPVRIASMRDEMGMSVVGAALGLKARLLGGFAIVTLVLGVMGIYAVVAETVRQRTREIGIRIALGAPRTHVLLSVSRGTLAVSAAGAAAGLAIIAFGMRVASRALLGIEGMGSLTPERLVGGSLADPGPYLVIVGVVGAVVLLGALLPARRALRVDPASALRSD